MLFSKLRLSGFKSFIEPTELILESGLTGIVGPNGCGKSNLVEALRWVMGESSAKQMRGGAMDDVIFSGSATRPSRNIAEVTLMLDNSAREAPAAFNEYVDIEVVRRIERESGSQYRINGREVRARDVQLLFADVSSGAHSSALVGQGQIGSVINAKPAERRQLLEEAAGITGLHSRRHEAELRLRGAETNLVRLDDVLGALAVQLQALKRQVRQARRYRNLSDHVRRAHALLFHLRWSELAREIENAEDELARTDGKVADWTGKAAAASVDQVQAAENLPELRKAEAEAAARLRRFEVERDGIEAEEARIAERRRDIETRLEQLERDLGRERALETDANEATAGLQEELARLKAGAAREREAERDAAEAEDAAGKAVTEVEESLTALTEEIAAKDAERSSQMRRAEELDQRSQRLLERFEAIRTERAALEERQGEAAAPDEAEAAIGAARKRREAARKQLEKTEALRAGRLEKETKARDQFQAVETKRDRSRAEETALASLLEAKASGQGKPVLDEISVEAGFEQALAAAFGDELTASSDESAPVHWAALKQTGDAAALPDGAEPFDRSVKAPEALSLRISQIGVVDAGQAPELRKRLSPGQTLVSRDGGVWRWDGYTVAPGAPVPAAARIGQRNRLKELRGELKESEARVEKASRVFDAAKEAAKAAEAEAQDAQAAFRKADDALNAARDAQAEGLARQASERSRLIALTQTAEQIEGELDEAKAEKASAVSALESLPDLDERRGKAQERRTELSRLRQLHAEHRSAHDRLASEARLRAERLSAIESEIATWSGRAEGANQRLAELEERGEEARTELESLANRPREIAQRRRALMTKIDEAETLRRKAADTLAQAENELAEFDRAARETERSLGQAREDRVRAEGVRDHGRAARDDLTAQISERLDCAPEDLEALAKLDPEKEPPEREAVETRLERLLRERETMGPVNLRAEAEAAELDEQITTLQGERTDLGAAIARLRQGITSLNREGRERILAAFETINEKYRALFTELFGGGKAHLKLVESDDPLEAGLEIVATPPGKQTRILSLLSGGEQALAALTLLFAVFLANPAPICVLDEVDAALDDANVERFCTLVQRIAQDTDTRFLMITHNRITMARVNRLFGVTMAERGVSQLVSVDLGEAEGLRATA